MPVLFRAHPLTPASSWDPLYRRRSRRFRRCQPARAPGGLSFARLGDDETAGNYVHDADRSNYIWSGCGRRHTSHFLHSLSFLSESTTPMNHFGIALSGGGFRGTLYHLGVIRFLRDADLLSQVSHITSVSGGSVLGAHLVLNWDRYNGSDRDFDEISAELIRFTQLDVRNRIIRRFPFTSSINTCRRLLRMGSQRQLTRPGLLEAHYEKHLYGDVPLSQLPERPQLHILSTNLSEGCLCSFNRDGLLLQRRASGKRDHFQRVGMGLATVPMAVTASSAFPGFFPPIELQGWDVGAEKGEFDRHAFTDGGVYDNLGLRMIRCIEQSWIRDTAKLSRNDFFALDDAIKALRSARSLPEGTPVRRMHELLTKQGVKGLDDLQAETTSQMADQVIKGVWEIIRSEKLYLDTAFAEMELVDPAAQSLCQYLQSSKREPDPSDLLWINRQIIEATLSRLTGKPCLRASRNGFKSVLVSDAGGKFKVATGGRAGGLVKTALRATDILMDRVWQLELEAFANTPGLIACQIRTVVERDQDPHAIHPELQRQAARIRTDLDRFSDLEVTTLVQHGYCVARKSYRESDSVDQAKIPSGPPWTPPLGDEPLPTHAAPSDPVAKDHAGFEAARRLRNSSLRRTWSTVLSLRDWPSYIWVPLILVLVLSLPYMLHKSRQRARQQQMVLSAIAASSPLYRTIVELLREGTPVAPPSAPYIEVDELEPPDTSGFEFVSDARVFDLRGWNSQLSNHHGFVYNRIRVHRKAAAGNNTHFRIQRESADPEITLYCHNESLNPQFLRKQLASGKYLWELDLDFTQILPGDDLDVMFEGVTATDSVFHSGDRASFSFTIPAETGLAQIWILMPTDREYDRFDIVRYPIGNIELAESVSPLAHVELPIGAIATLRFVQPEQNYRYECRWRWGASR
jgi:predicted acylesterase/phospholipase RssA